MRPAAIFRHIIFLLLNYFYSLEINAVWWLFIMAISPYLRHRRFADAPSQRLPGSRLRGPNAFRLMASNKAVNWPTQLVNAEGPRVRLSQSKIWHGQ
jgi:hypothetical protein